MEAKKGLTTAQRWFLGCGIIAVVGFVGVMAVVFAVLFSGSLFNQNEKIVSGSGSDKIGVVRISGVIAEEDSGPSFVSGGSVGAFTLRRQLEELASDPDLKAIVLRINSPGGSAVASEEMYQAIIQFRKSGKKVVASMGDMAASGGYYIALGADKIIASPSSVTGSIGVITEIINVSGLYDKLGLKSEVYVSGQAKDIFSGTRERSAEEKAIIQSLVDEAQQLFIERVAEGRKLDIEEVKTIADGRIYSGRQAADLNLVDGIGNFDDAITESRKLAGIENAKVVEYEYNSFWNLLLGVVTKKNDPLMKSLELINPTPGVKISYLLSL